MFGLGTIVNTLGILGGGLVGLLLGRGFPERFQESITHALGVAVLLLGASGVMAGCFRVQPDGLVSREDLLLLIVSLVLGILVGELLNIERAMAWLGERAQARFAGGASQSTFAKGFVDATILFCVGAMAVVGSLEDGILRKPDTLFAKTVLDTVAAALLSSVYGPGVLLSAAAVLLYQGSLTLLAGLLAPLCGDLAMLRMSMVGSAIIVCIGLNMLGLTRIRVANLIPATFIPLAYTAIFP